MSDAVGVGFWSGAVVEPEFGEADWPVVDDAVKRRIARLRFAQDRADLFAARMLAAGCVARLISSAPSDIQLVQRCPTCGGADHGRPAVAGRRDVFVSWAHSRSIVVAAAASAPVGVDVERRMEPSAELIGQVLHPAEQAWLARQIDPARAFSRVWTRKECAVKLGLISLDDASRLKVVDSGGLSGRLDEHRVHEGATADESICVVTAARLTWTDALGVGRRLRTLLLEGAAQGDGELQNGGRLSAITRKGKME